MRWATLAAAVVLLSGGCGRIGVETLAVLDGDGPGDSTDGNAGRGGVAAGGAAGDAIPAVPAGAAGTVGTAGSSGSGGTAGRAPTGGTSGAAGSAAVGGTAGATSAAGAGGTAGAAGAAGSAGATGGYGQGGAGGTGTPLCPGDAPAATNDPLIDDLEDGDDLIRETEGRSGWWAMVNDGSRRETQNPRDNASLPTADGAQGSNWSARTWGSGFTSWGAGLQVYLNEDNRVACPYDGSLYLGISFYAKGVGTVRVSVATSPAVEIDGGGTCEIDCYDYYSTTLDLTDLWVLYEIRWSDLEQLGLGEPFAFSPTEIQYISFEFGAGVDFDLYVDDLSFF